VLVLYMPGGGCISEISHRIKANATINETKSIS